VTASRLWRHAEDLSAVFYVGPLLVDAARRAPTWRCAAAPPPARFAASDIALRAVEYDGATRELISVAKQKFVAPRGEKMAA